MKLTPLDIHHKEFHRAIRGYSEEEVDKFLDEIAEEFERLFKDNIELKEQIEKTKQQLDSYAEMEKTLHNTLLTAQKSAEEVLSHAKKESELVLRDAELKAKETMQEAHDLKGKYEATLGHLKQAEEEFRSKFKSMLESYLRIADSTAVLAEIGSDLSDDDNYVEDDLQNAMDEKSADLTDTTDSKETQDGDEILSDVGAMGLPKIDMAPTDEDDSPENAPAFTGETFKPEIYPAADSVDINMATGTNDYSGMSELSPTGGLSEFTPNAGIPDMSAGNELDNHIEIDFAKTEENREEEREKKEKESENDELDLDNLAF